MCRTSIKKAQGDTKRGADPKHKEGASLSSDPHSRAQQSPGTAQVLNIYLICQVPAKRQALN